MAKTVDEYIIQVKTKGTKKAKDKVGKVGKSLKKLKGSAKRAAKGGMAVLGAAMVAAAGYSVKTAAEFQKLQTRLNTLYGSINAGKQAFDTFNQVASTTPFALKNVVEAGASLKAFGMDAEENIKGLSDLAAFMGVDIVEAAGAMGRAFAGGAGAADVLRDRGVLNIIKMREGIDDLSQVSLPEFRRMMKEAIEDPSTGIAGATTALSETFAGRYSNMMDSVDKLAASMGEKLLPIAEKVVTFLGGTADAASGAEDAFDTQIKAIETGQAHLRALTENLQKTEQGTKSWKIQMSAIRREYPEFLQGIKDEDITLSLLNDKLANYNDLSEERIAILEKEKKKAALLEKQAELIQNQSDAALGFAENLMTVDDAMDDAFSKAKHKIDLSSESGQNLVSELSRIKREVREQEQAYLAGDITAQEFYATAIHNSKEFSELLFDSRANMLGYNSALKSTPLEVLGQQTIASSAIASYAHDIVDNTKELTQYYKDNNTEIDKMNTQYGILGNMIKNIDDDIKEIGGEEDEGLIPAPSPKIIKQYEDVAKKIQSTIVSYQSGTLKLMEGYHKAELNALKSKDNKTIQDLETINGLKLDSLDREHATELDKLKAQQDKIREDAEANFQFSADNNILTEEEQIRHQEKMAELETQFATDRQTLRATHSIERESLIQTSHDEEEAAQDAHNEKMLEKQKELDQQLQVTHMEYLDNKRTINEIGHAIQQEHFDVLYNEAVSAEHQTFASIDRVSDYKGMAENLRNKNSLTALETANADAVAASEERFEADKIAAKVEYDAWYEGELSRGQTKKEIDQMAIDYGITYDDMVASRKDQHLFRIRMLDGDHQDALEKNTRLHEKNKLDIEKAAAKAKFQIAMNAGQGLISAFSDNAEILFNMNKNDKKNMLHLEKAAAGAAGIAEIVGIWKSEPAGLKGVPIKTVLSLAAALRTAGNIAKIDDQIAKLDQKPQNIDDGGGGSSASFSFGNQQAATGYSGVIDSPTNLLVGEAGAEMVNVSPLDGRTGGGGGGTTINVSGNVMSQDFVEGELPDLIKEAIRRGADFGIDDHSHGNIGRGRMSKGFRS